MHFQLLPSSKPVRESAFEGNGHDKNKTDVDIYGEAGTVEPDRF